MMTGQDKSPGPMGPRRWRSIRNWPFAAKFAMAPILALLGIGLILGIAVQALTASNQIMSEIITRGLKGSVMVSDIGSDFKTAETRLYRFMTATAAGEPGVDPAEIEEVAGDIGQVQNRLAALAKTPDGEAVAVQLEQVAVELQSYRDALAVVSAMLEIDFASAASLLTPFGALGDRVSQTVEELVASSVGNADANAAMAQDNAASTLRNLIMISLLIGLLLLGASFVVGREVVKGTRTIAAATVRVADGDQSLDIGALARGDELGGIATALETFRAAQSETERLRAEQEANRQKAEEQAAAAREAEARREAEDREKEQKRQQQAASERNSLASHFDETVSNLMRGLEDQARKVEESAKGMKNRASDNHSWSRELSGSSKAVLDNIQVISAAAEEMRASVEEISQQVHHSSRNVTEAVSATDEASATVKTLEDSVHQIGQIVTLINDIADQTNLLALNATIEAARAGEAGRGFAVVASEVKNLAAQTAKATNDIGERINQVQSLTHNVVQRMVMSKDMIGKAEESASAIASAVEEQAAATQEIARTVELAASETDRFSEKVAQMTKAASENGAASEELLVVITNLGHDFKTLGGAADNFVKQIRA